MNHVSRATHGHVNGFHLHVVSRVVADDLKEATRVEIL